MERTFGNDVVNEAHGEAEGDEVAIVVGEALEAVHHVELLALVSLIEGDLLGVGNETRVYVAEFAFVLLLDDGHVSNRFAQQREKHARH